MKNHILVIVFLVVGNLSSLTAQHSNQWMLGFIGKVEFNTGTGQYSVYGDTIYLRATNAGICDASGQIQFWSNGAAVFQDNRDSMQNGELFHVPFSQNNALFGMPLNQGAIALPVPGNSNQYYLFHDSLDYFPSNPNFLKFRANIYASTIDMSLNGGLGTVINNSAFIEDSIHWGIMTAVKHGNGRDWWLVSHEVIGNNFCVWLISPQGISPVNKIPAGTSITGNRMGQLSFSPEGQYLAFPVSIGGASVRVEVLSFDRCTGLLGNVVKTDQVTVSNSLEILGCQFSSSGRYLYLTPTETLYQYDMQAANFTTSRILLDTFNGTLAPFPATFSQMKLADDGKIYCHASNGNYSLHVINEPDNAGSGCNFVQNQFWPTIGSLNIISLPNMPNYELGALAGSFCDTLGLGISEFNHDFKFSVSPNPTYGKFKIMYLLPSNENGKLEVFDINGRRVYEMVLPPWSTLQQVDLPEAVSSGVFNCLITSEGERANNKIVIIRD